MALGVEKQNTKDRLLYVYGVTAKGPAPGAKIKGVDGMSAVEKIDCGDLCCWVSQVDPVEFGDLTKKFEDLDWLAEATTRHHGAVSAIGQQADILPVRFGVIFRTEDSLKADIKTHAPNLKRDLKKIKGAEEWGVKVFSAPPSAPRAAAMKGRQSGKEYLLAKAASLPRRSTKTDNTEISRFVAALERIAEDTAKGGKISGGQRGLQFQISLLVKKADRKKLETILKRFSKEWSEDRRIECTGPWPPFSFVS